MDTEAGRDWGREEEEEKEDRPDLREGDEGWTWASEERWKLEEGKAFTGPWTKSLNSSSSWEKPVLGAEDEGWTWACEERPEVEELEEGGGKEAGASKGPWKSLNSSLSSDKAGGREWVVADGSDGDESAKMKK